MKRAAALLALLMMTVLLLGSVNISAKTIDISAKENTSSYHCVSVYQNDRSDTVISHKADVDPVQETEYDADEIKEDGINTRVASVWIISISVVVILAVLICVIRLAKKNKN